MKSSKKGSTRQMMGITAMENDQVNTAMGDLVYYAVKPTNIGVLPESIIRDRVQALQRLLQGQGELEMMALNAWQSFAHNRDFYRERMEQEDNPAIRELLRQDLLDLDEKQDLLSTAREFYLIVRLRGRQESDVFRYLSTVERTIKNCGFSVRRCTEADIRQMLSVYYEQAAPSQQDAPLPQKPKKLPLRRKRRRQAAVEAEKDFLDLIAPSILRFYEDYYICGNTYRCVWAVRASLCRWISSISDWVTAKASPARREMLKEKRTSSETMPLRRNAFFITVFSCVSAHGGRVEALPPGLRNVYAALGNWLNPVCSEVAQVMK